MLASKHVRDRRSVLARFRAALDVAYGDRIERVVLFGSRARGDARPDSDYDVALFLEDYRGFSAELDPLVKIETDILWDSGIVVNALPLVSGSYHDRTALMFECVETGSTCEARSRGSPRPSARRTR